MECLATSVRLLIKICKGVRYYSYANNHAEVPVACMNLVGAVSDFTLSFTSQVCRCIMTDKQRRCTSTQRWSGYYSMS